MQPKNNLIFLAFAAMVVPHLALAQGEDPATKLLVDQARYWQSKNDYARSASIWKKVLLSNPSQTEAIYGIGLSDLINKNLNGANQALLKLKKVDGNSWYVAQLEQDIYFNSVSNAQILRNAQELGEAGKRDEAIAQYDIAFGGKKPQGTVALEYYNTLSYSPNGWKTARAGIERLAKQSPNNSQIKVSLGKMLTLNEITRVEGIDQLLGLAKDANVGSNAAESARLALTWIKVPQPNAFPVFEKYLKAYPDDTEIQGQLSAGIEQQKRLSQEQKQYSAETPRDSRAADALTSAKKSLAVGDDTGARASLEKSLKLDSDNPWARLDLARLDLKSGRTRAAKDLMYTMPYSPSANQANVLFASALFAIDLQDWKQAETFLLKIPAKDRSTEVKDLLKNIVVREQIDQAISLSKQGRKLEGLAKLDQIQSKATDNPETLSLLANAYVELDEKNRGLNLMRQVLAQQTPPKTEALLTYVTLLLKTNDDVEAATVLSTLERRSLSGSDRTNFNDLLFLYSLRQADQLRTSGNLNAAEARLAPLLVQRPNDPLVISSLAAVYQASGKNKQALDLYRQLIQKNPNNIDIQLSAARLAVQMKDSEFANARLQAALKLAPNDPDVIASVARIYRSEGKNQEAEALFERSLSLMTAAATNPISQNQTLSTKQFTANSVPTLKGSLVPLPASSVSVESLNSVADKAVYYQGGVTTESQRLVMADLNDLKQERSADVTFGTQIRSRNGNSGTSKLTDIETPLEIRLPAGDGKAVVQVTPVSLNVGSFTPVNYGANSNAINNTLSQSQTTASGIGISIGYKTDGVAVDIGTTPIGFTYNNLTGGIKLNGAIDDAKTVSYLLDASSRPVTDSLLSFAGMKNNATGTQWGGVMASGGKVGLSKDLGGYGFYGSAGFYGVNGTNVASNSRSEFGVGGYVEIYKRPDSVLTTGLNLTNLSYQQNLSNFTYGQGGYFSPQQYNALTVPVIWGATSQKISYQLRGALGYQSYSQNSSSYFPTNGALQSAAGNPIYPSQTSSGVAYNLGAGSEYQVAPKLFLGATAQTDNTATGTYRQWGAGAYLRYSFEAISGPLVMPLKSFSSPYGL